MTLDSEEMAVDQDDQLVEEELLEVDGEEPEAEDDDSEIVVSLDGEAPSPEEVERRESAPEWVKDLRKRQRELERENRELKAKVSAAAGAENAPPVLMKKPKLDDDGIDYDSEKYEAELEKWYEKKREVEAFERDREKDAERQQQSWNEKLESYNTAKGKIKVSDFDDAEEEVLGNLSNTQQGIIVSACDNPAMVVYALGKNPNRLKEISSIKDPIKFAVTVSKLENSMKITKKSPSVAPEKTVFGSSGKPVGTADKNLDRLRAEAEKTGDYTKVTQYKRQLKARNR